MRPILYSFRRCPYAIRARLAIKCCQIEVELREVVLSDKPSEMMAASPKGTVPVLILADGSVIDESLDIINWALSKNDPECWLPGNNQLIQKSNDLIKINDDSFKDDLDHYKYANRFPDFPANHYRLQAEKFLQTLEQLLDKSNYLVDNRITLADIAIFPFIRQFAFVDKDWFDQSQYKKLQVWLEVMLNMKLFTDVMKKYPQWAPESEGVEF
jgi:glutathione S-transferase